MPRTKYPIFKCLHRGEKGFTLIELLIVIAILGVIAAGVILNIGRFTKSGQKAAAMSELASVQTAVDAAMADNQLSAVVGGTVGPGYAPGGGTNWDINSGGTAVYVDPFLRREVKGKWTVETDGSIISGDYPSPTPVWQYSYNTTSGVGAWTEA